MTRSAGVAWRRASARVEWYCGRRGLERPMRVLLGGATLPVTVDEERAEGPASAGGPVTRRFLVRGPDGARFRISATSAGDVTVDIEARE